MKLDNIIEYAKLALRNLRSNLLRTILTCLIIALGIMALVGIQTIIGSLGNQVADVFSPFGTNQFTITNRQTTFESSNKDRKPNPPIEFEQAKNFKDMMSFPGKISISTNFRYSQEIKTQKEKTNPTYTITGIDENYLELNNQTIEFGRDFSFNELNNGQSVALITSDLLAKLFKGQKPNQVVGETIIAAGKRYAIIGVLEDKGQSFGGGNSSILIPLLNGVNSFGTPRTNYTIKMGVPTNESIAPAMEEAQGIMRVARNLRTTDEANFEIEDPNASNDELKDILNKVTMGGLLIAIVTLSGATIGLMNILLVSVTERIREIGINKAIGATVGSIRLQYFIEGILISIFGGILGILLGLFFGFIVSKLLKAPFSIPWDWVGIGFTVCLIVGLISSIYPAIKASKLNPIEALRQN